jgi:para-aminobenzoate synthetase/4-amino-4-deoxychorismate lyase
MQIIRDLEREPRGIYTGTVGFMEPARSGRRRRAQFNVAIRTVQIDRASRAAEYGTGGGVVWDSDPGSEYDECATKALVLTADPRPFELLETLLWRPRTGYFLGRLHIARLCTSALYFDRPVDRESIAKNLADVAATLPPAPHRVRLLVDDAGRARVETSAIPQDHTAGRSVRVGIAAEPVRSSDCFLYHKTTRRDVYDRARAARPDFDDVILWNERGEITESTVANVVVRLGRDLVTPPVSCGLLAGTYRAALLAHRHIREQVLRKEDLARADAVYLINSVRGWMRAVVAGREA